MWTLLRTYAERKKCNPISFATSIKRGARFGERPLCLVGDKMAEVGMLQEHLHKEC